MISIIDNGNGKEISKILKSAKVINKLPDTSGVVISDGKADKEKQKLVQNVIEKFNGPILGIGLGAMYIAAMAGGKITEKKVKKRELRLRISGHCPLTIDMKGCSVIKTTNFVIEELPDFFKPIAKSIESDYEMFQDMGNPIFGVQFNPELGLDGIKILRNFETFISIWTKYHKQ